MSCIYRPPGTVTRVFCDALADLLDELVLTGHRLVVCGDVNCPGPLSGILDHNLIDVLNRYSLKQHVSTHVGGNLLDVIATPDSDASLVSVSFSDHSVVSCRLNSSWTAPTTNSVIYVAWTVVHFLSTSSRRRSTCSRRSPTSATKSTFSSARCSDSSTYMYRCRPDAGALAKMNVAGYPTRRALPSAAVGVWRDAIGVLRPRGIVRRIQLLGPPQETLFCGQDPTTSNSAWPTPPATMPPSGE